MAVLDTWGESPAALSAAQTGTGDSTNTAMRAGNRTRRNVPAIEVVPTYGGSATFTFTIKGSVDGLTFYNIPYALIATPSTFVVAAITIAPVASVAVTAATTVANVATFTTAAHTFVPGDSVIVAGVTPAGYNGTWTVLTTTDNTHFTANIGTSPGALSVAGTAIVATPVTAFVYLLQTDQAWRYLKLNVSANTAVTFNATAYL
jgi:hypothetical protein